MEIVVICLSIFFGIPALFACAVYLEEEGKISKKGAYLMILGICLLPYIVSAFIGDDFLVFWAVYTVMMLFVLIVIGIIKLFHKE